VESDKLADMCPAIRAWLRCTNIPLVETPCMTIELIAKVVKQTIRVSLTVEQDHRQPMLTTE
jgi:hypothetical protein